MSNPTYIPLALMTVFGAIFATLISQNIITLMITPATYLEPAVESAAEDIAHVCAGNFRSATLAPTPPGASYQIETCAERNAALTTSTIVALLQFADFSGGDTKKVADGLKDTGEAMSDASKTFKKLLSKMDDEGKLILDDDTLDLIKKLKGLQDTDLNDIGSLASKLDKKVSGAADLGDATNDLSKELDRIDLSDFSGGDTIDCSYGSGEAICDSLKALSQKTEDLGKKSTRFGKNIGNILKRATRSKAVSRKIKKEAKTFSEIGKHSRELIYSLDEVSQAYKLFKKSSVVASYAGKKLQGTYKFTKKLSRYLMAYRSRLVFSKIHSLLEDVVLEENSVELSFYLLSHENIFDLIALPSTGVPYSQMVVNVLNSTDESVNTLAKKGLNITGNITQFSKDFKKNSSFFLAERGYYLTSSYIADIDISNILTYNGRTNVNPTIFFRVTSEFLQEIESKCEGDTCIDYALEISEIAKNITTGETTLDDLKTYADINVGGLEYEQEVFREVLSFFITEDEAADELITKAENFQKNDVASWMRNNCGTTTLHLKNIRRGQGEETRGEFTVEVSDCGLVVDCSPQTFCYLGAAVVSSDPWTPYIPITVASGTDAGELGQIIGLNYDVHEKILDPISFLGACGLTNPLQSIFICASGPVNERCKIVNCGKNIKLSQDNLKLLVDVENFDDYVEIRGNFLKW